jgi:beta-glucosidase
MRQIARPLDWVGVNYYTRSLYKHDASIPSFPFVQSRGDLPKNDLGWETYPSALTEFLLRVSRNHPKLPIYVTENGMSGPDDDGRIDFFDKHFHAIREAQKSGADVRGYIAWTLVDNFEWAEGYNARFGIVSMDPETRERKPKGSYRAFQQMLTA